MSEGIERIRVSISTAELERRWTAVRNAMEDQKIDVLVVQNCNDFLQGYVKWFTDIPAVNGYPTTLIFPLDDEMTIINCGPWSSGPTDLSTRDWAFRGVKKRLTAPYFPSLHYSAAYDAELVVKELKSRKGLTVGLLGIGMMSYAFGDYLKNNLPGTVFSEASDLVDPIKAVKSEEEIEMIRQTAEIQDIAFDKALGEIKPGKRDCDIYALVQHIVQGLGSEQQLIMPGSAPMGTPSPQLRRHFTYRELRKGDQFTLMIEVNGPGGHYAELGRTCVLGKASQELLEAFEMAKEAQQETLKRLKPGADPRELIAAHNDFLRSNGWPEEDRLFAHGQGYDLVERPAIREDESMKLKADMNITVHPIAASQSLFTWVCDNYLITETGASDCLHRTPKRIFEL